MKALCGWGKSNEATGKGERARRSKGKNPPPSDIDFPAKVRGERKGGVIDLVRPEGSGVQ